MTDLEVSELVRLGFRIDLVGSEFYYNYISPNEYSPTEKQLVHRDKTTDHSKPALTVGELLRTIPHGFNNGACTYIVAKDYLRKGMSWKDTLYNLAITFLTTESSSSWRY